MAAELAEFARGAALGVRRGTEWDGGVYQLTEACNEALLEYGSDGAEVGHGLQRLVGSAPFLAAVAE